jgi:hypothetical protein
VFASFISPMHAKLNEESYSLNLDLIYILYKNHYKWCLADIFAQRTTIENTLPYIIYFTFPTFPI